MVVTSRSLLRGRKTKLADDVVVRRRLRRPCKMLQVPHLPAHRLRDFRYRSLRCGAGQPPGFPVRVGVLLQERCDGQRGDGRQFDQDVQRWARRILQRITQRVSDDSILVCLRSLAMLLTEAPRLDVFFRIVVRTAGIRHRDRQ